MCSYHVRVTNVKDKHSTRKGTQITLLYICRELGSISRPTDYEKSVLTSRLERCANSRKSATGICRYITPPNPSTLWRRISVGLELRHRKCWLPWSQRCVNMLQGQTYTMMLPFTSTSCQNFAVCSDHAGSPNVKDCLCAKVYPVHFTCLYCREPGAISCP